MKIMRDATYEREMSRVDRAASARGFDAAMKVCEAERARDALINEMTKGAKELAEKIMEAKEAQLLEDAAKLGIDSLYKPTGFKIE